MSAAKVSRQEATACIDSKTKPVGSLGKIETLAVEIALSRQSLKPKLESCELLLCAGDHGLAHEHVSAYPQSVTRQMVVNFLAGGAASTVIARELGVAVKVIDCGVCGDVISDTALVNCRIGPGTRNSLYEPAMTVDAYEAAMVNGRRLARESRTDAVAMGEMGIGNSSAAALVGSKVMGLPVRELVGRGTGLGDAALRRKREVLSSAASRTSERLAPDEALMEYGGFEMVTMVGAMVESAKAGRLVIVDGYISTAAAVCALAIAGDLRRHFIFAHKSAERGHTALLAHVSAEPVLRLEMRLGEGTGALLAWPLIRCAAAIMSGMASFADAGVSGPVSDH